MICSSLLGTEQGHALEFPVGLRLHADGQSIGSAFAAVLGGVGSEPDSGDQVPIVTLGVLVHGAGVVGLPRVELLPAATTCGRSLVVGAWRSRLGSDVHNGERLEGILRGLVFESLLVS